MTQDPGIEVLSVYAGRNPTVLDLLVLLGLMVMLFLALVGWDWWSQRQRDRRKVRQWR